MSKLKTLQISQETMKEIILATQERLTNTMQVGGQCPTGLCAIGEIVAVETKVDAMLLLLERKGYDLGDFDKLMLEARMAKVLAPYGQSPHLTASTLDDIKRQVRVEFLRWIEELVESNDEHKVATGAFILDFVDSDQFHQIFAELPVGVMGTH